MLHSFKIISRKWLSHEVISLSLEKPGSYTFAVGQAVEVSMDHPRFHGDQAPFTIASLPEDDHLELIIKVYPDHKGITLAISELKLGDKLLIGDPWDSYRNLGPGIFIAAGTGITSFLSAIRYLKKKDSLGDSQLFFVNKTEGDVFLNEELSKAFCENFVKILTREQKENYLFGQIDVKLLRTYVTNFNRPFYICGPDNFAEQLKNQLIEDKVNGALIHIGY